MAPEASESSSGSPSKKRRFPSLFRKKEVKQQQQQQSPPNNSSTTTNNNSSSTKYATQRSSELTNGTRRPAGPATPLRTAPSSTRVTTATTAAAGAITPTHAVVARREPLSSHVPPPAPAVTTTTTSSKPPVKASWLCRTKYFRKMCDWAFKVVDHDASGSVDEKELYSGLLLIHLKLGSYAGPAACKPLELEKCRNVFRKFDVDNSGTLDQDEFRDVMMVLFSNVLLRVLVQWSMTLMIVPLVAQLILDGIYWLSNHTWMVISNLDEYNSYANALELAVEEARDSLWDAMPALVQSTLGRIEGMIQKIPDAVWNTIPLTLISCILGIVVVPYLLFKIDDYFQNFANRRATPTLESSSTSTPLQRQPQQQQRQRQQHQQQRTMDLPNKKTA